MRTLTACLLFTGTIVAQTPPAEVDKALRDRVNEFFQCHVDGTYRKAMEYVAEDTKDHYFESAKTRYQKFSIDKIAYNDDFTKATVSLNTTVIWQVQANKMLAEVPTTTTWKIEDGKWVWQYSANSINPTPMGPSVVGPQGSRVVPPKDFSQGSIEALGKNILQQGITLEKSEIELETGRASSAVIVVTNPTAGAIRVELDTPNIPGLSAKLDPTTILAGSTAKLEVRMEPGAATPPPSATVRLIVQPFGRALPVTVKFKQASRAQL
jgi:hypothetical protein